MSEDKNISRRMVVEDLQRLKKTVSLVDDNDLPPDGDGDDGTRLLIAFTIGTRDDLN
jgi:hypothetical protein